MLKKLIIFVVLLSGCHILDYREIPEPGPILFVSNKSGTNQLYSMNENGTDVKQLTFNDTEHVMEARWSPDGKKIAFTTQSAEKGISGNYFSRSLFIMNNDGTKKVKPIEIVINVQSDDQSGYYLGVYSIVWSSDSKELSYMRLELPESLGRYRHFVLNINTSSERIIKHPEKGHVWITDWSDDKNYFSGSYWHPDAYNDQGIAVAYVSAGFFDYSGNYEQYVGEKGFVCYSSKFGKSDSTIAFVSTFSGDGQNIYIATGKNSIKQITEGRTGNKHLIDWSSRYDQLLYNSLNYTREGKTKEISEIREIMTVDVITGSKKNITPFDKKKFYSVATSWKRDNVN